MARVQRREQARGGLKQNTCSVPRCREKKPLARNIRATQAWGGKKNGIKGKGIEGRPGRLSFSSKEAKEHQRAYWNVFQALLGLMEEERRALPLNHS